MELKHDVQLDIATANSRRAKSSWKNKKVPWSRIVERMSSTTRTPETVAEYKKMPRDQQAEIKDTGAFVGGYCNGGSRTSIRHRSIVALDADYAEPGLWDKFCILYDCAAAVYSTHKHTPESPRLRLVIPLAESVGLDEYQAIGRRIAADLGIDQFDDTTYQPARCMFWPSTSIDGEYVFAVNDAEPLDPSAVLGTYTDWRDISSWPLSSRVAEVVRKEAAKQADPLTKDGLVGSFCRAYTIQEAIAEFVPSYVACAVPDRYTYEGGSTAAGVVIYEDKFSYSFHATDPASGQLCNSWDLVRLHRFGSLDEENTEKAMSQRPSWKAMMDFAAEDVRVKAAILAERSADFEDLDAAGSADPESWSHLLKFNKDQTVSSTIENVVVILEHDPRLSGRVQYNEMNHTIFNPEPLPWRAETGQWTDSDDASLRFYLEKMYGLSGRDKIFDAVNVVAMRHRVHPVREFLDGCTWDGVPRVDSLLVDYLGAQDTKYTRTVTRKTLTAAVARIYNPGCKYDYMLTLRGRQGLGKSYLVSKLGGPWFSDSFSTVQGKDSFEQLQGVWLMEVGELAGMKKAESEAIKLFISKQVDRFRPAYGRRSQEFPRQCIFVGTTNESQFLRDVTGNRRFWVVDTPGKPKLSVWDDLTPDVVRQVWAEAVHFFRAGETLYLPRELESAARVVQSRYEEDNPKEGIILDYLDRLLPENWPELDIYDRRHWIESQDPGVVQRRSVSTMEVWVEALGGSPDRLDRYAAKELNGILARLPGWEYHGGDLITTPYGRQRYYTKKEGDSL